MNKAVHAAAIAAVVILAFAFGFTLRGDLIYGSFFQGISGDAANMALPIPARPKR